MDGCFWVYVVNTTEALLLFFKQRNLGTSTCRHVWEQACRPPVSCGPSPSRGPHGRGDSHARPAEPSVSKLGFPASS